MKLYTFKGVANDDVKNSACAMLPTTFHDYLGENCTKYGHFRIHFRYVKVKYLSKTIEARLYDDDVCRGGLHIDFVPTKMRFLQN